MRYLGVDFGLKRIGLAISDGELASPLKILEVKNFDDALDKLRKIVIEEDIQTVILGKPEGKIGKLVDRFKSALIKQGLDVVISDETLSTHRALNRMIELNIPKGKRKLNDAYAAAELLQDYLDQNNL